MILAHQSSPSAPAVVDQPVAVGEATAATLPSYPLGKGRAAAGHAARTRRTTPDLDGEVRLLEDADAELRRGDAEAALAQLAEHAAKYPSGALADEREGIRAIALCRSGKVTEGKMLADRFLSATRKSSLITRVRAACGIEKTSD